MSDTAMKFLIAKLDRCGIVAEAEGKDDIRIKYLTTDERRRVIAALFGLEVDELPSGRIEINHEIQTQLIARFIINEAELTRNRRM